MSSNFQYLSLKTPNPLSPELSPTICLAGALLTAWYRAPPIEGPGQILVEISCWLWLLLWYEVLPWAGVPWPIARTGPVADAKLRLALLAVGIAFFALARSLDDCRWIEPAVVPAIAAYRRGQISTILIQLVTSLVAVFCLKPTFHNMTTIAIFAGAALICFVALVAVYTSLIALFERNDPLGRDSAVRTRPVAMVCAGALPLLCVMYWFWISKDNSPHTIAEALGRGATKAVQWVFLFHAAQDLSWDIAAPVGAFAAATYVKEQVLGDSFAFIAKHLVAAIAALGQTIYVLPPSKHKHLLWLLVLAPLWTSFRVGELLHSPLLGEYTRWNVRTDHPQRLAGLPAYYGQHPILDLAARANQQFDARMNNQSTTIEQAVAEYKRRYRLNPPPGFEAWFNFAREKTSRIIDDYDTIYDSVAPFLALPPAQIKRFMAEATEGAGHIAKCGFRAGQLVGDCGPRGRTVDRMTAPYRADLPDFDILVSSHDEPTVLLDSKRTDRDPMWGPSRSHANVAKYVSQPCGSSWPLPPPPVPPVPQPRKAALSLPFVQDARESTDMCAHPEYAPLHGFIAAPLSFRVATKPAPILSQCKLSTFSDVLMPSQIYLEGYDNANDYGYVEERDPGWDAKDDKLYWVGSNTGGADMDASWRLSHRQRFVAMAEGGHPTWGTTAAVYLKESSSGGGGGEDSDNGLLEAWRGPNGLPKLSDVHFHAIRLCAWAECNAQMRFFHTVDRRPDEQQYRSKFLMDLDGNGYSGRFYSHLRSRSLSLKMTIFREWHDDRLAPWVHYIPVSLSMEELPETMRFLATTEAGMELAKRVADAGRRWWAEVLREEDFQVYFYRLLLELARLVDDDRVVDEEWVVKGGGGANG